MKALVTGGTGFVGSNLAIELDRLGLDVIVTGNESEQELPKSIKRLYPTLFGIDWDRLGKIDVLFHQAALNETVNLDREEMIFGNYVASRKLFEKVIENGCRNIVYASSTAIYGDVPAPYREDGPVNPLNPYAESKLLLDGFAMSLAARRPDVKIVGLRYCNVYGPGESHKGRRASMIYQLAKQMSSGKNPKIFKWGEQKRDYIYVKDVVKANALAVYAKESCVVNCGSGEATSFNGLVSILNDALGLKCVPEYIDNPFEDKYQNHTECNMDLAFEKICFIPGYNVKAGVADALSSGSFLR